jgi:hypothetical protein
LTLSAAISKDVLEQRQKQPPHHVDDQDCEKGIAYDLAEPDSRIAVVRVRALPGHDSTLSARPLLVGAGLLPFLLPNCLELSEMKEYAIDLVPSDRSNKTRLSAIRRPQSIRLQSLFKTGALNHSATLPALIQIERRPERERNIGEIKQFCQ